MRFSSSSSIDYLFLFCSKNKVILLVYLDDVLLFGFHHDIGRIAEKLKKMLTVEYHGRFSQFLGIKVEFREDGEFLSQSAYVKKIIGVAKLSNTKGTIPISNGKIPV